MRHLTVRHLAMRHLAIAIALAAGVMMTPLAALAHAHLDNAKPAADSVAPSPTEVTLWFTEAVEPKFSSIVVRDAKGRAVQSGKAVGAADNTAQLSVKVPALAAGTYTVEWRVLSVDTHRSSGSFSFTVKP